MSEKMFENIVIEPISIPTIAEKATKNTEYALWIVFFSCLACGVISKDFRRFALKIPKTLAKMVLYEEEQNRILSDMKKMEEKHALELSRVLSEMEEIEKRHVQEKQAFTEQISNLMRELDSLNNKIEEIYQQKQEIITMKDQKINELQTKNNELEEAFRKVNSKYSKLIKSANKKSSK